ADSSRWGAPQTCAPDGTGRWSRECARLGHSEENALRDSWKPSRRAQERAPAMDRSSLPDAIVAPVDVFVRDLVAWAAQHRDADLGALETAVRDGLRALA